MICRFEGEAMAEGITCYERDEELCENRDCALTGCIRRGSAMTEIEETVERVARAILEDDRRNGHADEDCTAASYRSAARAAIAAMPSPWRTIDSAPKDGTRVLGYFPGMAGYASRLDVQSIAWTGWGGGAWETIGGGKPLSSEITHWMPLPLPPEA